MESNRSVIRSIETKSATLSNWTNNATERFNQFKNRISLNLGWGKLIFAHTFNNQQEIARELLAESPDERNIAFYVPDPHVILSQAPQDVFLDPSHTFRCWLEEYKELPAPTNKFLIRKLKHKEDIEEVNRIMQQLKMVPLKEDVVWKRRHSTTVTVFIAEDMGTGQIIGSVMGVDHRVAFNDPENGSSLWALAVDPLSCHPGIGESLVRSLIKYYITCNRAYLDLSVMHNNRPAINLYHKLGFVRIPVFSMKKKNIINEPLYTAESNESGLNPYAMIICKEAKRRGIQVDVIDAEYDLFILSFGGYQVSCRESLSDLTSAVALNNCDNKHLTLRLLKKAGLRVPDQQPASSEQENRAFLEKHGRLVVKPARGEQGKGIFVDIRDEMEMANAILEASRFCDLVLLEEMLPGKDLRIVVIDYQVVAAALREPPGIVGDGNHSVKELIEKLSMRRAAQTGGESQVPMDSETERCVVNAGYQLDDVLPTDQFLQVRKTANLHTGGKLVDVTAELHPDISAAAVKAAETLKIPVTGLDFIVTEVNQSDYSIIEANERPGLANHEPRPTAERFIDLLFPNSKPLKSLI
ncbi:MAG: N-acetylglutaminylglutamine synthetase [SAR324 cluster bacterium]|nr:N-acetylglutaminylglutamine synthetase [SAR324 cluster bacterium]